MKLVCAWNGAAKVAFTLRREVSKLPGKIEAGLFMYIELQHTKAGDQPKPRRPRRKRRWFQFGISSLLLLTLAVAIILGWVSHEKRKHGPRERALAEIAAAGGEYEAVALPAHWYETWLGIKRFHVTRISFTPQQHTLFSTSKGINYGPKPIEVQAEWLHAFPEVEDLSLRYCEPLTSKASAELARMQGLKKLEMQFSSSSRASWSPPRPLDELSLIIDGTHSMLLNDLVPAIKMTVIASAGWNSALTVGNLPYVEELKIHASRPVTVCEMAKLQTLHVESRGGLVAVRKAPALKELVLYGNPADGGLYQRMTPSRVPAQIQDVPALARLTADNIALAPQTGVELVALQHLELGDCTPLELTDRQWSQIRTLSLRDSTDVTRTDQRFDLGWFFGTRRAFHNLETCRMEGRVPGNVQFEFPVAARLQKLDLHISSTSRPLEIGGYPKLRKLRLYASGWSEITLKELPSLEGLYVDGAWTTSAGRPVRLQGIPSLRIFEARLIDLTAVEWQQWKNLEEVALEGCGKPQIPADLTVRLRRLSVGPRRAEPSFEIGEFGTIIPAPANLLKAR